ncbi:MAG TPA: DUF4166 domain-containing protein [Actinomycetes bacterium]|nr:DUF4166 domain-containing protein [Actinomycetes bacterium]
MLNHHSVFTAFLDSELLDADVAAFHCSAGPVLGHGLFVVERRSGLGNWIAHLLRLPSSGPRVPVSLSIIRDCDGETWTRQFGSHTFSTRHTSSDGWLTERRGIVRVRLLAEHRSGALILRSVDTTLGIGRIRLKVPRQLSPNICAEVSGGPERYSVNVTVDVANDLTGSLVRYYGVLKIGT